MLLNNDCHNNGKDGTQCLFSSQNMVMILVGGMMFSPDRNTEETGFGCQPRMTTAVAAVATG